MVLRPPWAALSQLQTLNLRYLKLPPIIMQGRNNVLLPHLRELVLVACSIHSISCLLQLAGSQHLTRLTVRCYERFRSFGSGHWYQVSPHIKQQVGTDIVGLLRQKQQLLVVLELVGVPVSSDALEPIAAMHRLQQLVVTLWAIPPDNCTARFPSNLTALEVADNRATSAQVASPLQLQHLSRLQQLDLVAHVPSMALGGMPALLQLDLECREQSDSPQGPVALLRALQQATSLQSLKLFNASLHSAHASLQLFSALTASPNLTKLTIHAQEEQPLPQAAGAIQQMFPAGRELPKLQELSIAWVLGDEQQPQIGWCVDTKGLASIVRCCTQLLSLDIDGVVRDPDVSPLLRLPRCCVELEVGGHAFDDRAAAVIAQLTHLTQLCWANAPQLTDVGLQHLTALQALDSIRMYRLDQFGRDIFQAVMGFDPDDDYDDPVEFELDLVSNEGHPVWRQLEEICDSSAACLRARLQRQNAELAAHKAEIARLQQQLEERDAHVEQLQQQLAERGEDDEGVVELQQELSGLHVRGDGGQ